MAVEILGLGGHIVGVRGAKVGVQISLALDLAEKEKVSVRKCRGPAARRLARPRTTVVGGVPVGFAEGKFAAGAER